jgi:hypothetical protein
MRASLLQPTRARGIFASRSRTALAARAQAVSQMTATKTEYEVVVKANMLDPTKLGDCECMCGNVRSYIAQRYLVHVSTLAMH